MNTVPTTPEPLEPDPGHAHPSWCWTANACTAEDRLVERGVARDDVPMHRRDNHYGAAHVIPTSRAAEVEIRLEPYRDVYQPVEEEPDGVLLTFTAEYFGFSGTLLLAGEQMGPLSTAFGSLRDLFETDRNALMDRVAEALRVLGCISRGNADALLGLTTVQLTDREREAVLGLFPAGGER